MAAQKPGLGRGLGELFQQTTVSDHGDPRSQMPEGSSYQEIPLSAIRANPQQPRSVFDPEQLSELSQSIKDVGLLQPIVVRPLDAGHFELVMGERRLRASKLAGLTKIPAIVRPTDQEDLLRDALLENIQRVQLNPLEEAAAYQQLLKDFGCTQEQLADRIKKSRPQISNTMRLLKLPSSVQKKVAAGVLSAGHARALLGLEDSASMEKLAARVVAEGMSVRATEEAVTLFDGSQPSRGSRTVVVKKVHPRAATIAAALSERYDTRVLVTIAQKGKIVIEFAGEDDLDRILSLLD
ncbi:MAG: ParB/RepB/Spo0J family partition protein [Propionibacteriaceae bacterium]|nr:ParB/RepB/Spo0J family partition protein [Propionibacteriaceae bacterium]